MNKAAGPQFNTRAAEIRLAAKLLGKLIGLKNWRAVQLQKFKLLGNDLSGLLVSISPTFYARIFCTKVLREAYLYLHLRFELFWCKDIGANALIKCW
jgi:hypothetical protein